MSEYKISKVDAKIICLLQKDGRMPNTEIAKRLGITEATVRNRLQKLRQNNIIHIVAISDPYKLGFKIAGNIKIKVDVNKSDNVLAELEKLDELWYIALVTGDADVDVEFHVTSMEHLRELIYKKIHRIEGVISTDFSFLLNYVKNSYEWGTGE